MLNTRNNAVTEHIEIENYAMAKLSQTGHTLHTLFKPELDKRGAKQLLTSVLQPNKKNVAEVVHIAKTNPRLFFIKATAQDYAMDLAGNRRTIVDWSPYQALFGTSNKALLLAVKPSLDGYLETLPDGFEIASHQEQEKFPNGFDFPPCSEEFNQLMNDLELAITNDRQLIQNWKNPSPDTLAVLAKFRNYYQPDIVKTGHHFNMNEVIKTDDIHDKNWRLDSPWNGNQLIFLNVYMIGLQERLMTAPYLDAACTGLYNHLNKNQPLNGNFEVMNYVTDKKVAVLPFTAEDPSCRLGERFVIDSYYGVGDGLGCAAGPILRAAEAGAAGSTALLGKLCQTNTGELSRLMHTAKQQTASPCVIV